MFVLALFGCAVHTSQAGLVAAGRAAVDRAAVDRGPVELRTYEGRTFRLHLDEESAPVRYLGNATVRVEGTRFGRGLWVDNWYVQDAGDGSGGFVGLLRVYGSRLVVDDRNTRRTLVIADGTAPELRALVGEVVLLRGHVVGGETIEVAAYRVLAP